MLFLNSKILNILSDISQNGYINIIESLTICLKKLGKNLTRISAVFLN